MSRESGFILHGPTPLEPLPKISLGQYIYEKLLRIPGQNIAFENAHNGEVITFQQILGKSVALATALKNCGYEGETVLSLSSENNINFFVPLLAAVYIGAAVAPINHVYTSEELRHTLNISKPSIIFCSNAVYQKYNSLRETLSFIKEIIVIDSAEKMPLAKTIDSFISDSTKEIPPLKVFEPAEVDVDDRVVLIMCSSGTTGLPKGVMLTHTNIHVRLKQLRDPRYHRQEEQCVLGILPWFHAFGLITCLGDMTEGRKIIFLQKFDETVFLSSIEKYRIQTLYVAPPVIVFLSKSQMVYKYDLSSLRTVLCGAAPLSKQTEMFVKERLKINDLRQGYGLTEATLAVVLTSLGDYKEGSSGKVISYMQCKICDTKTGKILGPNEVGELCFKGPMVMKGYYNNATETGNVISSDGWLKTGDVGYYDENEYIYIVDRIKELIKYKGYQKRFLHRNG